jgi:hypothetical protein
MDGVRIVKNLLPLIILLSGVAHAQIDNVTLTGVTSFNTDFVPATTPSEPFSVSFTVDTQSGVYSTQPCPTTPTACGFTVTNLTVTNAHGTLNGVPVQVGNGIWGGGGSGPFSEIFGGIGSGNFGPVAFNWGFDISTLGLGPSPSLDQILRTPGFESDQSYLNGFGLDVQNVSVTAATSVPEPGTLGLLTLTLAGLFASRVRRRARIGR